MDLPEGETTMTSNDWVRSSERMVGGKNQLLTIVLWSLHGVMACMCTHTGTHDIYTHSTHTIINNNNNTLIDINLKITRMFLCVKRRLQRYPKPSTHTFTEHNNLESQCIISNVGLSP